MQDLPDPLRIEPRGPLAIVAVTTDKIVYKPGEAGQASVTVKPPTGRTGPLPPESIPGV